MAELARARLYFVEQPRVLDRDHRLIGKAGHQLDLFRCKWLRHGSRYEDHPYDFSLAQQRGAQRRSVAHYLLSLTVGVLRIGEHVGNMNHSALDRRSSHNTASIHRNRVLFDVFLGFRRKAITRRDTEEFTVT